jgi:cobalt-zinc-cadmium efflux system outer membrane protein
MRIRTATAVALWACLCALPRPLPAAAAQDALPMNLGAPAPPPDSPPGLSLQQAIDRVVEHHPDLRLYVGEAAERSAELDAAAQAPAWRLQAEAENLLGTGSVSGVRSAELSLGLSRVLERGGKRDARRALAALRLDALGPIAAARRLDLLSDVARRHLDLLRAQASADIQAAELQQRQRAAAAAGRRARAGAAPQAVLLAAEAQAARAQIELAQTQRSLPAQGRRLALLWGEDPLAAPPDTPLRAAGDLFALPALVELATLRELLENTPELEQFADRRRLAEARLRLADTEARPDFEFSVGMRRLQAEHDTGLMLGFSLPLGSRSRAEPGLRAAQAALSGVEVASESARLQLQSTLLELHAGYTENRQRVRDYRRELLPRLQRAEAAAESAYRAGALDALSWSQLQAETTATRHEMLQAAYAAQLALIELQRLTAEPLLAAAAQPESTP